MKKYLAVALNSIKVNFAYRVNNFIMIFAVFLSFMIMFYFWSSIYRQGNQIGNYSLKQMLSYYVLVTIFELLIVADGTAWTIGDAIRNGQISNHILQPIKYIYYKLAQSLGGLMYRIALFSLPIGGAIFILRKLIIFPPNGYIYASFFFGALLSYLLYFLIYFSVGILGFWVGNPHSLFFTCYVIISFMQGQWLPLDLLPRWFLAISNYLPFQYLFYVPVSLAAGRMSFSIYHLLVPAAWCIALYLIANILYNKGIKNYEGYGI